MSSTAVCFELPNGMICTVDADKRELVQSFKWNWMKSRGVAAFMRDQTILLHNMIAPFKRVSFLDGNKLNCRRSNMIDWRVGVRINGRLGGGRPRNNIRDCPRRTSWEIHRKIIHNGEVLSWQTLVGYGPRCRRTREQARLIAKERVENMMALSREDFIEYVKAGRNKRTTYEIISEWDVYQGRDFRMNEYLQEGVCHAVRKW